MTRQKWLDEFAERLKLRMEVLDMSVKELSKRSGVKMSTVYTYLEKRRVPTAIHVAMLAKALVLPNVTGLIVFGDLALDGMVAASDEPRTDE